MYSSSDPHPTGRCLYGDHLHHPESNSKMRVRFDQHGEPRWGIEIFIHSIASSSIYQYVLYYIHIHIYIYIRCIDIYIYIHISQWHPICIQLLSLDIQVYPMLSPYNPIVSPSNAWCSSFFPLHSHE